jgi:peptide/nickel transport system substrate-binding protein
VIGFGSWPPHRPGRRLLIVTGAVALLGVPLAGCGAGSPSTTKGATVTFALPPDSTSTYIFPLQGLADAGPVDDNQFQMLLYRPLYWFGLDGKPVFNEALSLAAAPVYSNGGRTVTINLKSWQWSDGKPITSRDVEFWINELKEEKVNWYGYVPGAFPDNLVSESYPTAQQVVLTFNQAYSQQWLLYNELSQITPLPQASWDKTSATSPVGNYDLTPAGAAAVYNYLNGQAKVLTTYDTNPLWKVVDGPFRLQTYNPANAYTVLVPNPNYSGTPKATIGKLVEQPFTSYPAELNGLRSGTIDYGYLPPTEVSAGSYFKAHGYTVASWPTWGIAYAVYNFTNPTAGPIFKQLYFRQALQKMVDQPQYIKEFWGGYAVPTYGPVPLTPATPYLTQYERSNPYPYDPAAAGKLLSSHGWAKNGQGVLACEHPGTGTGECGAGIAQGQVASFSILYTSGNEAYNNQMAAFQSTLAQAGIQLTLKQAPFGDVEAAAFGCTSGSPCTWDMAWWAGWTWDPDYLPTAGEIFHTGAGGNAGSYSNSEADQLITAEHTQTGNQAIEAAENFLAKDLPVLYLPQFSLQISVVKNTLHGWQPQDPVGNIYPQDWTVTGQ